MSAEGSDAWQCRVNWGGTAGTLHQVCAANGLPHAGSASTLGRKQAGAAHVFICRDGVSRVQMQAGPQPGVSFAPLDSAGTGCLGRAKKATLWPQMEVLGAAATSPQRPGFWLYTVSHKPRKNKKIIRQLKRIGPFNCETPQAADEGIASIKQTVRRCSSCLQTGKTIVGIVNPHAGQGK